MSLDSGMVLHDCQLLESNGKRWIGLPGKAQLDADKNVKKDATTGKVAYTPTVSIPDRARRDAFSAQPLAAIDEFRPRRAAA